MTMKTYAFIFARGGSKGLPGKNIKNLCGKPLLVHSIDIAQSIDAISEVFVSTDDDEIREIALKHKAKVISRPKNLSSDRNKKKKQKQINAEEGHARNPLHLSQEG